MTDISSLSSLNSDTLTSISDLTPSQLIDLNDAMSDIIGQVDETLSRIDNIQSTVESYTKSIKSATNIVPKNEPLPLSKANPVPKQVNDGQKAGEPTNPAASRRKVNLATSIGQSNQELVHVCDFTINLKLEACGKTFEVISANWATRLSMKAIWAEASTIPFFDDLRMMYDTLKGWYDTVKNYINQIKMYVKCMKQIIQAIADVIKFLATLPANLLASLMDCITGFVNMFQTALSNTVNGVIDDLFGSQNDEQQSASDATTTASTSLSESQQSQQTS